MWRLRWSLDQLKELGPPVGQWVATKAAKIAVGLVICNIIIFGLVRLLTGTGLASPEVAALIAMNAMGAGLVGGYALKLKKKAAPAVKKRVKRARKSYRRRRDSTPHQGRVEPHPVQKPKPSKPLPPL